jgi:proteasome assembly chaperone (PAC2) family protein
MNLDMFRFTSRPQIEKSSLVIGWTRDTGNVSGGTAEYVVDASDADSFCQIEPADFFPVGGVTVEDDIAQFPESRFFYDPAANLVILRTDEPQSHRYDFLNGIIGFAQHFGKAEALYTVNGIASLIPHTAGRRVLGVFNDPVIQRKLQSFVAAGMTWQGAPPTSTYLLWLATNRHLRGAGLWIEVPFYLADYEDFWSIKTAVSLFATMFGQNWDLAELDELVAEEDELLAELRADDRDIDIKIRNLELGEMPGRQEQLELTEAVRDALKQRQGQG